MRSFERGTLDSWNLSSTTADEGAQCCITALWNVFEQSEVVKVNRRTWYESIKKEATHFCLKPQARQESVQKKSVSLEQCRESKKVLCFFIHIDFDIFVTFCCCYFWQHSTYLLQELMLWKDFQAWRNCCHCAGICFIDLKCEIRTFFIFHFLIMNQYIWCKIYV